MKKRWIFLLMVLVIVFCTACGENTEPDTVDTDPVEGTQTVEVETESSDVEGEEELTVEEEETIERDNDSGTDTSADKTEDADGNKRINVDGMGGSGAFDIDTPCEICGGSPSQMFTSYTDGMPDEPAFYCELCTLTCYFCGGEATTHYNKPLWGEIFTCQDCYDGVHGES